MDKKFTLSLFAALAMLLCATNALKPQNIVNQKQRATYYHDKFENRRTSSGERFSQKKYTAAHKTIKFGTLVLVTDSVTNRWVIVKVNDRCPRRGVIDLSKRAAERISIMRRGRASVKITELPDDFYPVWESQDSMTNTLDNPQFASLFKMYSKASQTSETSSDGKLRKNVDNGEKSESRTGLKTETQPKSMESPDSGKKTSRQQEQDNGETEKVEDRPPHSKVDVSGIHTLDQANFLIQELPDSLLLNSRILQYAGTIKIVITTSNTTDVSCFLKKKYPQYTITEK